MTVESLLHHTDVPEHVVLTLDATAFASRRLPLSVRLRTMRGLTVRWDDSGHGPYGALLPLIEAEAPNTVILVDDAHLVPRDLVATLLAALDEHPRNVVVAAGTALKFDEDARPTSPSR